MTQQKRKWDRMHKFAKNVSKAAKSLDAKTTERAVEKLEAEAFDQYEIP